MSLFCVCLDLKQQVWTVVFYSSAHHRLFNILYFSHAQLTKDMSAYKDEIKMSAFLHELFDTLNQL